jgi:predicted HTH domain antitoxin
MNAVADLIIPKEVLDRAHLSAEELSIEIATHLYATKRLTMGQAKRLAGLDQISFQKELAKRNIYLNYDVEDLHEDMRNLGLELRK